MVFPPAMVEMFGRDTLLEADVYSRRELDDGAVLTVAYENPIETGPTQHLDRLLGPDPPAVGDEALVY